MPCYKVTADQESLIDTPSALWMCMMGHQTASLKASNGMDIIDFFVTTFILDTV